LFATPPNIPGAGQTRVTVAGLANGVLHFVGLGIRRVGVGAYQRAGPVVTATPGSPLFVAWDSTAVNPDGATPATAFSSLFTAALQAFADVFTNPASSRNIWIKGGGYNITSTLPLAGGVNVYGGFGGAFDLATRDVTATPTNWIVVGGQKAFDYGNEAGTDLPVIVDGVRITGNGVALIAGDANASNSCGLEMRSVVITDMADRGMRIRNGRDVSFDIVMTHCQSSRNGADGLNVTGAHDVILYNSVFASNFQEGVDLSQLVPETGGTATLDAENCQFFGNGAEGVDCTMTSPLLALSGDYSVQLRGCLFERNAAAGCLVDCDFELSPGFSADVQVLRCVARGNGRQGFLLDLDGPLNVNEGVSGFFYGNLAISNGLDGVGVTSESRPSFLSVSTSAMISNQGAGLRIEGPVGSAGNCAVAVTHCLFAANTAAGMISRDLPASATSSIAYFQSNAFDANTLVLGSVSSSSPAAVAFSNAPEEYGRVLSRSGAVLNLASPPAFPITSKLELANDGVERSATSVAGSQVTLSAAPQDLGLPGLLSVFAPGAPGVLEDYNLGLGSIAAGAGLAGADAGPLGSAAPSQPGESGALRPLLLNVLGVTPPLSDLVGANDSLVILFSKPLQAGSANASTVRARRGATVLNNGIATVAATLTLLAPAGGWGAGDFRVELDGILATDGSELSGAVVLPFSR
jgi:hypothetical protein